MEGKKDEEEEEKRRRKNGGGKEEARMAIYLMGKVGWNSKTSLKCEERETIPVSS